MLDPDPQEIPTSNIGVRKRADTDALAADLAALSGLDAADLRAEWRRLYRSHPPKKLSRDLLELGVAWKLQERGLGGLSAMTKRQLAELAKTMATKSDLAKARKVSLQTRRAASPRLGRRDARDPGRRGRLPMAGQDVALAVGDRARDDRHALVRPAVLRTAANEPSRPPATRQPEDATMSRKIGASRAKDAANIRCAIYTRKSSEEGLEQEFNSLDAQREACEAYIRSQKSAAGSRFPTCTTTAASPAGPWSGRRCSVCSPTSAAGRIDTVVVYKVDRLTRSLSDFAKIVEAFDAKGVSFVSVTQQFNTTTSMGRLTLNMLLSFAQFEREVTGERIRDKIAASKQKGMWMGGLPPLGYDVEDRKLVVNSPRPTPSAISSAAMPS